MIRCIFFALLSESNNRYKREITQSDAFNEKTHTFLIMGNACHTQVHSVNNAIVSLRQTSDSDSIEKWLSSIQVAPETALIFSQESLDRWAAVLGIESSELNDLKIPLGDKIILKQELLKLKSDKTLINRFLQKTTNQHKQVQKVKPLQNLSEIELEILKGNIETVQQEQYSRKLKLYFITNGNDMNLEINAVLTNSIPKIQNYAKNLAFQMSAKNLEIDVVDVKSLANTYDINLQQVNVNCLNAIKDCFKNSNNEFPAAVIFQGHKYGRHQLPPYITQDFYEKIFKDKSEEETFKSAKNLIDKWYHLDENIVGDKKHRVLVPISTHIENFGESPQATVQWWEEENKIFKAAQLLKIVDDNGNSLASHFDTEIRKAVKYGKDRLIVFQRNISQVQKFRGKQQPSRNDEDFNEIRQFVDVKRVEDESSRKIKMVLDDELDLKSQQLSKNVEKMITEKFSYEVDLIEGDITVKTHSDYFSKLCDDFEKTMITKIDEYYQNYASSKLSSICQLAANHLSFMRTQVQFANPIHLKTLLAYIEKNKTNKIFLVEGESGSGKTHLMSAAGLKSYESDNLTIFITCGEALGISTSSSLKSTLINHLKAINTTNDKQTDDLGENLATLSKKFTRKNIVIIIDSLDGLTDLTDSENSKEALNFLPSDLPENVRLLVSTSSSKKTFISKFIKEKKTANFLFMKAASKSDSKVFLQKWLSEIGRSLSAEQLKNYSIFASDDSIEVPNILRLKLVYMIVENVRSFENELIFENERFRSMKTIEGLLEYHFSILEQKYGKSMIRSFIAYMIANGKSISSKMLQDLMTVEAHEKDNKKLARVKSLTTSLLARVEYDLSELINIKYYPEKVLFFDTKQFWVVGERLYFGEDDKDYKNYVYVNIVNWYSGNLAEKYPDLGISNGGKNLSGSLGFENFETGKLKTAGLGRFAKKSSSGRRRYF